MSSDGTDPAQSASTDARDEVKDFFQDFDHYALKYLNSSDRTLLKKATRLLKERADTEISRAAYRDQLNNFRTEHPDFYGNFFGDPFYATYDLRYTRLAELRQQINTFINPQNSVRSTASFYCSPYSYDPAFNGQCRGLEFTTADFFFLPSGFEFEQQDLPSAREPDWMLTSRRDIGTRPRSVDPAPREPDTSRTANTSRSTQVRSSNQPAPQIDVPDDAYNSMREVASSLEQKETILRIRQEIERRGGEERLSVRERVRVARQIAEADGRDELARSISRIQDMQAGQANRRLPGRRERNELGRRTRRQTEDRTRDSGSSRSAQRRSKDAESSNSSRQRSRSSENSSGDSGS